ncbi:MULTISPECIES: DUF4144 family protein [Pseudoalteromonas]|jgi:hypothetical protein|uniref:Uncharacterized protein n=2 Tax=Pseudoalteromonas aliena TaxID=247523 RepID=A0A1Q2GYI4_9GAMM|nr:MULTISPECIES: DUF4144 family protein [Pseudoalteromonas]AQQ00155.1 hypothetical protein B0W48_10340 [Pseudoalteromonas aliena]MBE0358389.1 hypothetical protein [Pseudoalteromonas aliena SW19]
MLNQFPQLLIVYNELEIAHTQKEREEHLHSVTTNDLADVVILNKCGEYCTLDNTPREPLSAEQLAVITTSYLLNEGHCCLSKITTLTVEQAFNLLEL